MRSQEKEITRELGESCHRRSLFRKFRFFQQERLHIGGDDEARAERTRTVDVSDAAFAINEKDAHG
jgi:hypothetical protein